jgi:DNA polymerase I-like protein with 3'-5' exonuclease and polymerase domains
MFWQDLPVERGRSHRARVMPAIPETGWKPRPYPNLNAAKVLSVDVETYDPELIDHGPGWARKKGHICGFSVGTEDRYRQYFPIRHEIEPETNMDPGHSLEWLKDTIRYNRRPIVGANLIYDVGWLKQEGIEVDQELVDIQFAEALLDASSDVDLESMAQKYLGEGKVSDLLKKWIMDYYAPPEKYWRRDIYRTPPRLAGFYGEGDADLPLRIAPIIYRKLVDEGLFSLFQMECGLIPLTVAMRFAGVKVDLNRAEQVRDDLNRRIKEEKERTRFLVGRDVNVNSSDQLSKAFDQFGLEYPFTAPTKKKPKGQPSFTTEFLKTVDHPLAKHALEIKRLSKLNGTFIEGYILDGNVNSKLYCSFHPLRGESGGTGVGRYSSSHPNLQNIPIRDKELGPLIRSMFVPDEGHIGWRKFDYSQIQYRFLVHFAVGPGAEEARQKYIQNPKTDYHAMVQETVEAFTHRKWDRRPVKNLNFGLSFGMGDEKAGRSTGLKGDELDQFLDAYHKATPFAKKTMEYFMNYAETHGYIRTILGRKARFTLWEPAKWGTGRPALPYEQAIREYGRVRRAYLHKALACELQGCEGDMIKSALYRCWKDGIFDITGVPRLLVHDETDFSDAGGTTEAYKEMRHIMETCLPLKIPVKVDCDVGPDWGTLTEEKT